MELCRGAEKDDAAKTHSIVKESSKFFYYKTFFGEMLAAKLFNCIQVKNMNFTRVATRKNVEREKKERQEKKQQQKRTTTTTRTTKCETGVSIFIKVE